MLRTKLLVLLAVFLPIAAHALPGMRGQFVGSMPNLGSGTQYAIISGSSQNWTGSEGNINCPVTNALELSKFRVCLSGPSGTGTRVFRVRKNGVNTAITCTITSATCCQDLVNTALFAANDLISLSQTVTGTVNSTIAMWSTRFESSAANEFPLCANSNNNTAAAGTRYFSVQGSDGGFGSEQYIQGNVPTAGTISRLTAISTNGTVLTAPIVVTLMKNNVATALSASIAASATVGTDSTNSVSVIAGDVLTYRVANGSSADRNIAFGANFAPTVDGESIVIHSVANGGGTAGTVKYAWASGGQYGTPATEVDVQQIVQACTIRKLSADLTGNLPSGTALHTVRVDGADTTITCTVPSGQRRCFDTTHTAAVTDDQKINYSYFNSVGGLSTSTSSSMVLYIDPAASGGGGGSLLMKGIGK